MTTQYGVTRLEGDGDLSHSDKHQLQQAERQLQAVSKELVDLEPRVEGLKKQQRSLQADIRKLKSKASNGGYTQMNGEKKDGLSLREQWKRDSEEMWKKNTKTTLPGDADHHDDSADDDLSPRDRFLRDNEEQWSK